MKKLISILLSVIFIFSCFSFSGFAAQNNVDYTEILFEEKFDVVSDSVAITDGSFSYVARPENGENPSAETAYGALLADGDKKVKTTISLDKTYYDNIVYEMDFRLENAISSGANELKMVSFKKDLSSTSLITLNSSDANGYTIRVCSRDEEDNQKFYTSPANNKLSYKTWYTLTVHIDTANNNYDVYINNMEVAKDVLPFRSSFATGLNKVDIYTDKAKGADFLIDNIRIKRELALESETLIIGKDYILGHVAGMSVDAFMSQLVVPGYSTATLYSDYENKTVNTTTISAGNVLELRSNANMDLYRVYTINNIEVSSTYYVSPNGDNNNNGLTPQTAFKTPDYAIMMVRLAKNTNPDMAYTVKFMAGDYVLSESIEMTNADSGNAAYPITYEAYGDGPVNFKGSKTLDVNTDVKKVTDTEILNSIISTTARENLYQIDLKAKGIEIPAIPQNYGFGKSGGYYPLRVYINGQALTEARFPNDLHIPVKALNNGDTFASDGGYDFNYYDEDAPLSRTKLWDTENRDVYIAGTIAYQWAYNHILVKDFDPANKRIVTAGKGDSAPAIGRSYFYFTNVMEEIDVPGESYIDEKSGILYFYPFEDLTNATIEVGTMKQCMFKMTDVDYVTFKDINFLYTGNNIFEATNSDYFTFKGCTIAHTAAGAIKLSGHHTLIENNHIYDLAGKIGVGGVHLTGSGDRESLVSGESKIRNNKIHDTDVIYKVSQSPAIYILDSVGTEISNNEIYNGTAYVVRITDCNDILIKRNEIHHAVTMSSDAGAVTWGRDITLLGFQVIENYFHDIGNDIGIREQESTGQECKRTGQQALFHDDGSSGPYAYGNIFYQSQPNGTRNVYASVHTNGGQYGIWENNIYIGGEAATFFSSWRTGYTGKTLQDIWWLRQYNVYDPARDKDGSGGTAIYWDRVSNPDINFFENEVWKEKYGAQFGAYWTLFTPEQKTYLESVYDPTITNIKNNQALLDAAKAHEDLLTDTNIMKNNVLIDTLKPIEYKDTANYHEEEGSVMGEFSSDVAADYFVDYGTNFKLTDAGLSEIQKVVPAFKSIDFSAIGLLTNVGVDREDVILQDATFNADHIALNIVNESSTIKNGILVVLTEKNGLTAEMKFTPVYVLGNKTTPVEVVLTKAYDSAKVFVLKDILSMRILSNIIEK